MKCTSFIFPSLLFLVAGISNANAQTNDNPGHLTASGYTFARAAVSAGQMEITLGQIAVTNAQDASVRQFGETMVKDHQAANQELVQIITQKGASSSDTPDSRMMMKFQGLKGTEFDRAYMKQMVSDHKAAVRDFQAEADNGGDDIELKDFAGKTLPTLRQHLIMARETEAKVKSSDSR